MSSTWDRKIQFTTWNVKGLNNPIKRSRVLAHLAFLQTDIAFVQETHLRTTDIARMQRGWVGNIFHSKFNTKARGAMILIHKNIPFEANRVIADTNGRFIIVSGQLLSRRVVLACVYAPNWDDNNFINNFFASLPNVDDHALINGGDFNCVVKPELDRSSPRLVPLSKMATSINSFIEQYSLFDPWRLNYPTVKAFSFFSPVHHTYSRIDFFLLDTKLIPLTSRPWTFHYQSGFS